MRNEQTSIHLLLASIVTMFGVMLILVDLAMSWELWMVPVILVGNTLVWILHIGRTGSETFYENLCAGLLMVGFFFFGVHRISLYDMPAVACMLILVFSMFDRRRLLYMTAGLYLVVLLYHGLVLGTITWDMGAQELVRLGFGATVVTGSMTIARYRINRRRENRKRYDRTLVELEKAGRQNAEFLSNVSHELRTPINMVLGISEVILEKGISREIREDMQSIKLAGKRLSNQINNMLDYTEIMEGTLTASSEPYRITSVLNDILTMTAMQSNKHHLEMVFDMDPRMPSVLVGDVEKISHVLKIILENSIKFTEEGGINLCMEFRQESYGINLMIDIYDTGIGMTGSQLTQMCDDFYQADTGSSRFAGGLGLGLPIARGLLHAMGGFIHFESKEQEGLQVHITIPQGVEDSTPAMRLWNPGRLCIACYFRPEKYNSDEVRRYYDNMIMHMVEGLGIEGYQAHNFDGLLKLQASHHLTHVFIAQTEYEENSDYYEKLTDSLRVIVIAERDFILGRNSRLWVIRKPFSALSVVNLLNGEEKANGFEEAQAAGRKPFSCAGVKVLAVDDEEMNLVVAKGVLGSYGIEVDTCLSGREALERCASTAYDIVFLDHMMPGFDGVQTLKHLRELNGGMYRDLPVIALTANTISGAREMFRHEGFTEFVPKPIERAVLERVLRKVLPRNHVQFQYEMSPALEGTPEGMVWSANGKEPLVTGAAGVEGTQTAEPEIQAESGPVGNSRGAAAEQESREESGPVGNSRGAAAEQESQEESVQEQKPAETTAGGRNRQEGKSSGKKRSKKKAAARRAAEEKLPKEETRESRPSREEVPEQTWSGSSGKENRPSREEAPEQTWSGGSGRENRPSREEVPEQTWSDAPEQAGEQVHTVSFTPLSDIGINVQLGLDYCCGETEFYEEMLRMFCSQAEEKKAEIISLYESANWNDYTVKVHALKSTSLTIGAEQLAERARLLEQAGKKGNLDYIYHCHSALLELYDQICETIARL